MATYTAGVPVYVWAKGLDAREVTVDAHAFGGNLATTDTDVQLVADKVDGLILGPSISDDAPEDVAGTAAAGTSGEVPPKDHVHRLPTDNTLAFNSNDELAVNVTDVIDRLNETVEYYSNETGDEYDDNGHASMGEDYDTSAHRHIIHKVQIDINGAGTTNGFWRAGVFAIDDSGTITAVLVPQWY